MNKDAVKRKETGSFWRISAPPPTTEPLSDSKHVDVCVVGAGIAGLTVAYLLARAGQSVTVLDDGPAGGGVTGATTAHLTHAIDDGYFEVERLRGQDAARLAAESHTSAIDRIETIVREEGIDCGFSRLDGYLFLGPEQSEEILDRELEATHRAGLGSVTKVPRLPLPFDAGPCLRFPGQGQFHPLEYVRGLVGALKRHGGLLFTGSHADQVEGGDPARIQVGPHEITARAVIVATNTPINDRVKLHTKQAPYMTYALGGEVPKGSIPPGLYWDTADPYHYLRLQPLDGDRELLIVGGEDHKTGQADDVTLRHQRLETWARARLPMMQEVAFTWSGQVMETLDGLAMIGRNPMDADNVYVVTGDSGMGMTHGTIAGMLISDLILGRSNPWVELYDPSRKPMRAAGTFLKEAGNMAAQYTDWVKGGDVESEDAIAPGEGAVLRHGLGKMAVYREPSGELHRFSAVCPHLGCIVTWNASADTWDCPCHGSRFDKMGKVFSGPANRDLPQAES